MTSVNDSTKKWNCKSCRIPRNIEWGHKGVVTNTCTVDNMFQTVFLAIYHNPELLNYFPDDEAHNTLKMCLSSIANNKCFEAQEAWYKLIRKLNYSALTYPDSENNFWGNASECSYAVLSQGKNFQRIFTCPNNDCPEPVKVQDKTVELYIRSNEGPAREQIRKLLAERDNKKCRHCGDPNRSGKKLQFSSAEKIWFIEFLGSGYHTAQDKTHEIDLDKSIQIPDENGKEHTFKLQSITYHQDARSHFVSVQRVDDSLILADHILERNSDTTSDKGTDKKKTPLEYRYRAPLPSDTDFLGPNRATITSIVYVRQFD